MTKLNVLKALGAGIAAAVIATGCATAKQVPAASAAASPAPAPAAPAPAPAQAMAKAAPDDVHVVQSGEHLWGISGYENIYGDPYQWPLIYRRNIGQIVDADLIYPGQELKIRREVKKDEVETAIVHAKTRGAWSLGPSEDADFEYIGMYATN